VLPGVLDHPEPEIEDVVFGSNHVIVPDGTHEHLRGCGTSRPTVYRWRFFVSPFLWVEPCRGRLTASEARISFNRPWLLRPKQANFLTRLGGSRCTHALPAAPH
jgi:hypothetical protein